MKPETQGAAQRTLYPLAPCCHAFMFSGWRWGGGPSADFLTAALPREPPWCADLGPGRVQGSQGERPGLCSPLSSMCPPTGALLLCSACWCLDFPIQSSFFLCNEGKGRTKPRRSQWPWPTLSCSPQQKDRQAQLLEQCDE